MNLTIVGSEGIVGGALKFGFEMLGHQVQCHDIKLGTKLEKSIHNNSSHICFICVPTPKKDDGFCDVTIVNEIVNKLWLLKYRGIIVIKSTVSLGTTQELIDTYSDLRIVFNPEFLKERSAIIDFTERQDVCIIGTHSKKDYKQIKKAHGHFPKKFVRVTPSEAEACKYFNNALGATLVSFANAFYETCKEYNIDYSNVKNAISNREFVPKQYLEVNDSWRSWAGTCWSKDIVALSRMVAQTNIEFFDHLITENEKYKKTVPPGMRQE